MQSKTKQETVHQNRSFRQERRYTIIVLLLTTIPPMVASHFFPDFMQHFSLEANGTAWTAFTYQFLHVNAFHLAANIWILAGLVLVTGLTTHDLLISYVISAIYGLMVTCCPLLPILPHHRIVGLSAVLYAAMGLRTLTESKRSSVRNLLFCSTFMLLSLLLPNVAVHTHACCFILAFLYSLLTKPLWHF